MTLDRDPFLAQRPPLTENGQRRQSQTGVKILPSCKFLTRSNNGTYMGGWQHVQTFSMFINVDNVVRGIGMGGGVHTLDKLHNTMFIVHCKGCVHTRWWHTLGGGILYKPFEYSLQMDTNCWLQSYFDWVKGVCVLYAWAYCDTWGGVNTACTNILNVARWLRKGLCAQYP